MVALFIVLSLYAAVLAGSAFLHSPTFNEVGHLPAEICHWRFGRFDLYRVNPPLPRMIATLPVLLCRPNTDWTDYSPSVNRGDQVRMGVRFVGANGTRTLLLYSIGRLGAIAFSLVGAIVCWQWPRRMFRSSPAGWGGMAMWCTLSMLLGHGPLVMPDVPAAAMGVLAGYRFHVWLESRSWTNATLAGVALGLAELCKTTLLVLLPIWAIMALVIHVSSSGARIGRGAQFAQLLWGGVLVLYVINTGYGFHESFKPIGAFVFKSKLFCNTGAVLGSDDSGPLSRAGRRWAECVPVPVPADYLYGIDWQQAEFEADRRSYCNGAWKNGGWWYYHLYGLIVKTPLGTLCLAAMFVISELSDGCRRWKAERDGVLLFVIVSLGAVLCLQSGFSNHVRYSIPVIPFVVVWLTKLISHRCRRVRRAAVALVVIGAIEGLCSYPHSISYFNSIAGGSRNGHFVMLDSNVAWGQDLLFMKRWLDEHQEARPLKAVFFGLVDPRVAGIQFTLPPTSHRSQNVRIDPGWYAVDVNYLHSSHYSVADGNGGWRQMAPEGPGFEYFSRFRPVAQVGYSIFIYHVTDANEAEGI